MPPATGPVSHPERPKCPRGRLNRARDSLPGERGRPDTWFRVVLLQLGGTGDRGYRAGAAQNPCCSLGTQWNHRPTHAHQQAAPRKAATGPRWVPSWGKSRLPRSRPRGEAPKWGCSPDAVHRPRACQGTWSSCQDPQNTGGSRGRQTDLGVTPGGPSPGPSAAQLC